MTVGFYISQILYGGAEIVLVNLANEFSRRGYQVVLITTTREAVEPQLDDKIVRYVLTEEEEIKIFPSALNNQVKLRRIIGIQKIDVLISFMGGALFQGVIATLGKKTKSIISIRNDPESSFATFKRRFLAKTILPLSSYCVFQTAIAQAWFPKRLKNKSCVIPNGIKSVFFDALYAPDNNLILTCGRLEPQKNHKMLLSALSKVVKNHPSIKLVIVGEGSMKEELISYAKKYNINDHVIFAGSTTNIVDYYKTAGIFVLSSDYEGIPNVLLEAMAVGMPVISTDCPCGGPKMIIQNGENGLLVPVGDEIEMQKAIERVLDDFNLKTKLEQNARDSVKQYQFSNIVEAWMEVVNNSAK